MTYDFVTLIAGATIGLVVSLVTTIVNSILQNRRDEKERSWKSNQEVKNRWWDRKVSIYQEIVSSLVEIIDTFDIWMVWELEYTGKEISSEKKASINKAYSDSYKKIKRTSIEGDFLISSKSSSALRELIKKLRIDDPHVSWFDTTNEKYMATTQCLDLIRGEALEDLEITNQRNKPN